MTLSKIIANIERKIREGKFTLQTEVEVVIVEKHNGKLVMAEIGKNSIKQLQSIFDKWNISSGFPENFLVIHLQEKKLTA